MAPPEEEQVQEQVQQMRLPNQAAFIPSPQINRAPEVSPMENKYLEEVMAKQEDIQHRLKKKAAPMRRPAARTARAHSNDLALPSEALGGNDAPAVDVRITGFWRFRTVIVPPNAYVVHTTRGRDQPVTIGMGKSFGFNPYKDAYLVVPATTQTILISAPCICKERQGILVQGYVQWIIADFATAYKKLDFSDPYDPMSIVNTQLKEQAEATIKDTVATMSIDDVLSDKQPIIKELTRRLREGTEGDAEQKGLGLSIVTVQIKEAVVSSARLWETLQTPFRSERRKDARLAELENDGLVNEREAQAQRQHDKLEIETGTEAAERRSAAEAKEFNLRQAEKVRRAKLEAETIAETVAAEKATLAQQAELNRLELEARLEREEIESKGQAKIAERDIEVDARRQKVANDVSEGQLRLHLVEKLPELLERMPKPDEQRNISIRSDDHLAAMVGGIMEIIDKVRARD